MSILTELKPILLDTSTWVYLFRDLSRPKEQERARRFLERLIEKGYVPLLTLHHLDELMNVRLSESQKRIILFRNLPQIAVLHSAAAVPGTFYDLRKFEILQFLANPNSSISDLQLRMLAEVKYIGGEKIDEYFSDHVKSLRNAFNNQRPNSAMISVLSPNALTDKLEVKLKDIDLSAILRSQDQKYLDNYKTYVNTLVAARGDEQIASHSAAVSDFFMQMREEILQKNGHFGDTRTFLSGIYNLDPKYLSDDMTFQEAQEELLFRKSLELFASDNNFPLDRFDVVRKENIPSWLLENKLKTLMATHISKSRSDRHIISNTIDRYLACFSAYFPVVVDKRTFTHMESLKKTISIPLTYIKGAEIESLEL